MIINLTMRADLDGLPSYHTKSEQNIRDLMWRLVEDAQNRYVEALSTTYPTKEFRNMTLKAYQEDLHLARRLLSGLEVKLSENVESPATTQ